MSRRRVVIDFTPRRRADLAAEQARRLAWGRRLSREILALLGDMRLPWHELATFLRGIARRGVPTERDEIALARLLVRGRYGPAAINNPAERMPAPSAAGEQLSLDLEAPARRGPGKGRRRAARRRIVHDNPEGAA